MKNLITLLIATVGAMASFCHKEPPLEPYVSLQFILPMTVRPVQPTYHIGDTIWLEASFSDSIYERTTDKKYRFVDFDFASSIFISKLTGRNNGNSLSSMPFAGNQFDYFAKIGSINRLNSGSDFYWSYINNSYSCRIGIIAKSIGIFAFNSQSWWVTYQRDLDLGFIDLGKTPEGGRRVPYLQGFFHIINEGQNNNYDIFKNHCNTTIELLPDNDLSILYDQTVFAIEVVK